jgi:hypothetical protein
LRSNSAASTQNWRSSTFFGSFSFVHAIALSKHWRASSLSPFCQGIVGVGEVGPDSDGGAVLGDRLVQLPMFTKGLAEVVVEGGVVGLDADGGLVTDLIEDAQEPRQVLRGVAPIFHQGREQASLDQLHGVVENDAVAGLFALTSGFMRTLFDCSRVLML